MTADTEHFNQWEERVASYSFGLTMIDLDAGQHPPEKGADFRARARAALALERKKLLSDPETGALVERLASFSPDPEVKRRAVLWQRQIEQSAPVPEKVLYDFERAKAACEHCWRQNRFGSWRTLTPSFRELVRTQKAVLAARGGGYELLLGDLEPGWTVARYDAFFDEMKRRLLPLIRKASSSSSPSAPSAPSSPSSPPPGAGGIFPEALQHKTMAKVLDFLEITPDWSRVGESAHPLTTFIASGDVRLTTRYHREDPTAAILSTVHESGHAWYAHNVDPRYDGTILAGGISAAMHESQSRLCENHFGRRKAFWQVLLPELEAVFPGRLGPLEPFMRRSNAARPGPIRTMADELTYPIHILVRYEIEKELFSGRAEPEDLPELWNSKMKEYLGVTVANDAEGILQDMHWPYAYFGYFPVYALGSAYAAQFFCAMEKALPVDDLLLNRRYGVLTAWLRENIHKYGALYDADDLLLKVTGSAFDPEYYFRWLEDHFG